jgi:hypothetical protein
MNPIFKNMLFRYSMRTKDERTNATHEVMQQIALAGLYKAGFFNRAAFYGDILSRRDFGESELLLVRKLKHTVNKVRPKGQ